jgi:hypothetical protein
LPTTVHETPVTPTSPGSENAERQTRSGFLSSLLTPNADLSDEARSDFSDDLSRLAKSERQTLQPAQLFYLLNTDY